MTFVPKPPKFPKAPPASAASPQRREYFKFDKEPEVLNSETCEWSGCPEKAAFHLDDGTGLCSFHHSEYVSNNNQVKR